MHALSACTVPPHFACCAARFACGPRPRNQKKKYGPQLICQIFQFNLNRICFMHTSARVRVLSFVWPAPKWVSFACKIYAAIEIIESTRLLWQPIKVNCFHFIRAGRGPNIRLCGLCSRSRIDAQQLGHGCERAVFGAAGGRTPFEWVRAELLRDRLNAMHHFILRIFRQYMQLISVGASAWAFKLLSKWDSNCIQMGFFWSLRLKIMEIYFTAGRP